MNRIGKIVIFPILIIALTACAAPAPKPTEASIPTETPLPTATAVPTATLAPKATATLPPQTPGNWAGILDARAPDLQEINQGSVWMALGIDAKDMQTPGLETYTGTIQKEKEYLFPIYWCAKTAEIFHNNMQSVFTQLVVNGEVIPDEYIFTYNYNDDSGWFCNYRSVMLSGWQSNTEYVLEMRRVITQEISDGEASYAPGAYIYQLTITAQ